MTVGRQKGFLQPKASTRMAGNTNFRRIFEESPKPGFSNVLTFGPIIVVFFVTSVGWMLYLRLEPLAVASHLFEADAYLNKHAEFGQWAVDSNDGPPQLPLNEVRRGTLHNAFFSYRFAQERSPSKNVTLMGDSISYTMRTGRVAVATATGFLVLVLSSLLWIRVRVLQNTPSAPGL